MMTRLALLILLIVTLIGISGVTAQDSTYTLKYGDVLDVIAASFNVSVDCLAQSSGIDNPNKVRPGDTLIIDHTCPPYNGAIPIAQEPATATDKTSGQGGGGASSSASTGSGNSYTVERGDVLDLVAAAFDVDVNCLASANDLGQRMQIFPGDVLTIDMSCPRYDGEAFVPQPREDLAMGQGGGGGGGGGSTYIVRVGDYLEKIAATYNVETTCLGEANNLANPGRIFPGDEIVIATNCPSFSNGS